MSKQASSDILVHDIGAEQAIIVSICEDNDLLRNIYISKLKPTDFYNLKNRYIYQCMLKMIEHDIPVQYPDIFQYIRDTDPKNAEKYGQYLLVELDSSYSAVVDPHRYANLILKYSHLRQISLLGEELIRAGFNKALEIETLRDTLSQKLALVEDLVTEKNPSILPLSKLILTVIDNIDKTDTSGIDTNYSQLDKILLGLKKSDLIILAGRPAMGKTAFAVNIMRNIGKQGFRTLLFSMEMSKIQIAERLLSIECMMDNSKFKNAKYLEGNDRPRMDKAGERLRRIEDQIIIDDMPALTLEKIKSSINRLIQGKKPPDLVIIDYLQLLTPTGKFERRELEVSNMTRTLKIAARTYDIPIIALSQLNRDCERRLNKRPQLSDLRDSGAIEQDADIVAFIYRDEIYNTKSEDTGLAEIIVSKNRSGATGTAKLTFLPYCTKFANHVSSDNDFNPDRNEEINTRGPFVYNGYTPGKKRKRL
jgi:replicative DNA helicase